MAQINFVRKIIGLILPIITISYLNAQIKNSFSVFDTKKSRYKIVFEDNFNKHGLPNSAHWLFRKNIKLGGSSNPQNVVQCSALDSSNRQCLLIKFTYDGSQKEELQFKGGGVVSTHNFGYGYYETIVKLYGGSSKLSGLHQSFWSMGLTGTNEAEGEGIRDVIVNADIFPKENRVLEIDGFEMNSRDNLLAQNYHIYAPLHIHQGLQNKHTSKNLNKWIKMAYEWLPGQLNYYIDDSLVCVKKLDSVWNVYAPQNLWFTALPTTIKAWGGLNIPPANVAMQIDYFSFSAKHLPNVNRIGNSGFENSVLDGNSKYPVAWIVAQLNGNDTTAVRVITDSSKANSGKRLLAIQSAKHYKATTKQIIEYIPDGAYQFSAFVKSSGTQKKAQFEIASGGVNHLISIKKSSKWVRVILPKVVVKNHQAIIELKATGSPNDWLYVDDIVFSEIN